MARVRGDDEHLDGLAVRFEALVGRLLRRVARAVARLLGLRGKHGPAGLSEADLAGIPAQWVVLVDAELLPALARVYRDAGATVTAELADVGRDVAALTTDSAEQVMAAARNRLVGVGDELWQVARTQLAAGMAAGEDVRQLAARVQQAAGVSARRATVIARTEVTAAANQAVLAQARALDDPTVVKEWLCVAAGTRVASAQPRQVVERRRAAGWLATLRTQNGRVLTVTPNHPVLTDRGWVRAHSLNVGDNLVCHRRMEVLGVNVPAPRASRSVGRQNPDVEHMPPPIDEVFRAAADDAPSRGMMLVAVDFYSDPVHCEVQVVPVNSDLAGHLQASFGQPASDSILSLTDTDLESFFRHGSSTDLAGSERPTCERPTCALPRGSQLYGRMALEDRDSLAPGADAPGFAMVPDRHTGFLESVPDGTVADAVALADRRPGVASQVLTDDRVDVERDAAGQQGHPLRGAGLGDGFRALEVAAGGGCRVEQFASRSQPTADGLRTATHDCGDFSGALARSVQLDELVDIKLHWCASGHAVYDLATVQGWFVAEGIIVHNSTPGPGGVGCDIRTRPSHCAADGQRVRIGEPFEVGQSLLMFPGDPTGPVAEIASCRCSMAIDLDDEPGGLLTAAVRDRSGRCHDKDGRWVDCDAPGAVVPDVGAVLKDALNLGGKGRNRIRLDPGEELLGSRKLTGADSEVLLAATRRADGSRTVRMATGVEDAADWGANNRGGTAVLDERGVGRLRSELERMGGAEKEYRDRYKAAERRHEKAKAQQRRLDRRRYGLEEYQAADLQESRERLADIDPHIAQLQRVQTRRVDDLPSEAYDDWHRLEGEKASLPAGSQAWRDLRDTQRGLVYGLDLADMREHDVLDRKYAQGGVGAGLMTRDDVQRLFGLKRKGRDNGGSEFAGFYDRDATALENLAIEKDDHESYVRELTAHPVPLSPDEARAVDAADAEVVAAGQLLFEDLSEVRLVDGAVSGEWTDVGFRTDTDETGDVRHHVDVRPADAPDDWYPGYDGGSQLTAAELRKLSAALGEMVSGDPADAATGQRVDMPGLSFDDILASLDDLPGGPDVLYHGSRDRIGTVDREIFLTPSKRNALGYMDGHSGTVHAVRVSTEAKLADEDDLWQAGEDVWGSVEDHFGYRPNTYELADDERVRAALAGRGFAGAEFTDNPPAYLGGGGQHKTTLVWDPAAVEVIDTRDVPAVGPDLFDAELGDMTGATSAPVVAAFDRAQLRDPAGIPSTRPATENHGGLMAAAKKIDLDVHLAVHLAGRLRRDRPVTAAAAVHTRAMVALVPSDADVARLAVDGGEPPEQLHLTLMYLGDADTVPAEMRARLLGQLGSLVEDAVRPDYRLPLEADGFAVSVFNPGDANDRDTCVVLGVSGDDLDTVHDMVQDVVDKVAAGAGVELPDQHAPWTPHLTLVYTDDVSRVEELTDRVGPVTFDRLRVVFAGEHVDIPLDAVAGRPAADRVGPVTFDRLSLGAAVKDRSGHCHDQDGRWVDCDAPGVPDVDLPGPPVTGFKGMSRAGAAQRDRFRVVVGQAIPPAWTDVHIADDLDNAALLARGRDSKGRVQAIYSAAHTQGQAERKFSRIRELAEHLDKLDHALERDAMLDDNAAALLLIRRLGMRPGSNRDTGADKQAHGATNLLARHVTVDGDRVRFDFTGKKGVHIQLETTDPLVAAVLRERVARRGPDDPLFDTNEARTRDYMRSTGVPDGFLLKDLRTVRANVVALREVKARGDAVPRTRAEFQRWRKQVAEKVSAELGNTPALALSAYINPTVFTPWLGSEEWA